MKQLRFDYLFEVIFCEERVYTEERMYEVIVYAKM